MILGKVIHKYRVASEITIRDFCKALGISRATLVRIEAGREASAESLRRIFLWLLRRR